MGFFDWLSGSQHNVERSAELIWLTQEAKLKGLADRVVQSRSNPNPPVAVILVTHFPDSLEQLGTIATGLQDEAVTATLSSDLVTSGAALPFTDSDLIEIIVDERHPLAKHDETILDFARRLPCKCRVTFLGSLEDALMMIFSGDWVEGVLRKLGMDEDEVITSKMLSRRIRTAQRKLELSVISDLDAGSAKEWLMKNLPSE